VSSEGLRPRVLGVCVRFGSSLFLLQIGSVLEPAMPVNLSIKNAPDQVVQRLRERARRHHRSLQGELMAIIEEAVGPARPLTRTRS
jgi:Arc-like DNA binding domain